MFLQGWVNGILINESSVYGTLCIVLLKILNMGLYFSEIDTRGWPYRRRDLLLPFNHSFAVIPGWSTPTAYTVLYFNNIFKLELPFLAGVNFKDFLTENSACIDLHLLVISKTVR